MAATLAHLKSRELVPPDPAEEAALADEDDEDGLDPRQELIRRLLEYQKFKDAAGKLADRPVTGRNVWPRGAAPRTSPACTRCRAARRWPRCRSSGSSSRSSACLSRAKVTFTHDVVTDRISITDRINELVDRLEREGSFAFESCFAFVEEESQTAIAIKGRVVVTFLAILEMTRLKMVRLTQARRRQPDLHHQGGRGPQGASRGAARPTRGIQRMKRSNGSNHQMGVREQPPSEKTEDVGRGGQERRRRRARRATWPTRRQDRGGHRGASSRRRELDAAPTSDEPVPPEATERPPRGAAARSRLGRRRLAAHAVDCREPAVRRRQAADAQAPRRAARRDRAGARARRRRRRRGGAARAAAFSCTRSPAAISSAPTPRTRTWVQKLLAQKPVRLTRAQIETLAICAYRQPVTRPEIDEIRGVDSGGTLKTLLDRSLMRILGKKEEAGRPMLYGTTKEFLEFFNLRDLKDLPTLREFHELSEEHQAQVAALEGVAPRGNHRARRRGAAARRRAAAADPPRDHDAARGRAGARGDRRLIRTAGVATDSGSSRAAPTRGARGDRREEFEHEPTREYERGGGRADAHPRQHHPEAPATSDVDDEFDRSATTTPSKKPRPDTRTATKRARRRRQRRIRSPTE